MSFDPDLWRAAEFVASLREHGSLSEAARQRGESQSAVSKRLKAVEAHVGAALVLRGGRRILLTDAGHRLVEALRANRPLLARLDAALAEAVAAAPPRRAVRLGMGDSLTQSAFCRDLAAALARGPSRPSAPSGHGGPPSLELHVGNAAYLEEMVLERRLDAAVVYAPSKWPNLVYREIFRESVHFVTHARNAPRSPPADPDAAIAFVATLGVVVPTLRLVRHRAYLDRIFGPHFEARVPIRAMTDGILPARALLAAGVGAGFLQAHLVGAKPDPAAWYAFEPWRRQHRAHLVFEAERREDPAVRAVVAAVAVAAPALA